MNYASLRERIVQRMQAEIRELDGTGPVTYDEVKERYAEKLRKLDGMHQRFIDLKRPDDHELRQESNNQRARFDVAVDRPEGMSIESWSVDDLIDDIIDERERERVRQRRWGRDDFWNYAKGTPDITNLFPDPSYKPKKLDPGSLPEERREEVNHALGELEQIAARAFDFQQLTPEQIIDMQEGLERFRSSRKMRTDLYLRHLGEMEAKYAFMPASDQRKLKSYIKKLEDFESGTDFISPKREKYVTDLIARNLPTAKGLEMLQGNGKANYRKPSLLYMREYLLQNVAPTRGSEEGEHLIGLARSYLRLHRRYCEDLSKELRLDNQVRNLKASLMRYDPSKGVMSQPEKKRIHESIFLYRRNVLDAPEEIRATILERAYPGYSQEMIETGTNLTELCREEPRRYETLLEKGMVQTFAKGYKDSISNDPLAFYFARYPTRRRRYIRKRNPSLYTKLSSSGVLWAIPE